MYISCAKVKNTASIFQKLFFIQYFTVLFLYGTTYTSQEHPTKMSTSLRNKISWRQGICGSYGFSFVIFVKFVEGNNSVPKLYPCNQTVNYKGKEFVVIMDLY